jgi:hypothetical protein
VVMWLVGLGWCCREGSEVGVSDGSKVAASKLGHSSAARNTSVHTQLAQAGFLRGTPSGDAGARQTITHAHAHASLAAAGPASPAVSRAYMAARAARASSRFL